MGAQIVYERFGTFQNSLLSSFLVTFFYSDPREGMTAPSPILYIILLCIYDFIILILMINMLIALIYDLFSIIKLKQQVGIVNVPP